MLIKPPTIDLAIFKTRPPAMTLIDILDTYRSARIVARRRV